MKKHTLKEIIGILNEMRCPWGCPDIKISSTILTLRREMVIRSFDEERGSLLMEGIFPKMSLTPGVVHHTGKRIGVDNKEIFEKRLGLSKEQLAELSKEKII
jgi:crotonobetainyl-CoA:carnitine CoA-transferase CaiB-like acyl-CoA transferase